ncbi:hypothetical protein [Longispora albida]|uniref:hypothetical protein n=1 Tax=Longispora albida TaxID=203523 RepID=UPI0003709EA7|nr:hypothetical protein [Longispora albida]
MKLAPGDVVRLTKAASPQFGSPLVLRLTKISERRSSVSGWAWIEGYQLDTAGQAITKRTVFVNLAGISPVGPRRVPATV